MLTEFKNRYQALIATRKLKSSKRRDLIVDFILQTPGHFTMDDIYPQLLKIDRSIGIATIYRTLRLLVDSGILREHSFGEKRGYFELTPPHAPLHDHLICTNCGKIIEFHCQSIEQDKQRIAQQYQFAVGTHKLEIFGICAQCQQQINAINLRT